MLRAILLADRFVTIAPIRSRLRAPRWARAAAGAALALLGAAELPPARAAEATEPCRLKGIEHELRCGSVSVPEDPQRPYGRQISIRFALQPALARRKAPDPLFVLAGGPGQAATDIAASMQPVLARVNARRDIVYVDQRGTGQSNPLACTRERAGTLAAAVDPQRTLARLDACIERLSAHADLRQYATWVAVRDFDAVRAALGAERINLWGGSYGTRAALEYLRQFPQRVRSVILDGVAPATMALPASLAVDADAALQAALAACDADPACRAHYPQLEHDLRRLGAAAERAAPIRVRHPLTGATESLALGPETLAGLLRAPLYAPQFGALLPFAIAQAASGRFEPLFALHFAMAAPLAEDFAEAMHFAVICAEDLPRIDAAARAAAASTRFGAGSIALYERACARFAPAAVPSDFYDAPAADVPVLLLSGGADPVTPPRHGARVAASLPRSLHLVAPRLGHGVSAHGCAPDLIHRFLRQADAAGGGAFAGLDSGPDAGCLARLPAPPAFIAPRLGAP